MRALLCLLLTLTLIGCGSPEKPKGDAEAGKDAHAATAEPAASDGGGEAGGAEEEEAPPASEATNKALGFTALARLPFEEVSIPTEQPGGVIYGRLYDPFQKPESDEEDAAEDAEPPAPTVRYPLVVLLHELNGSHRDWGELPAMLVSRGYAALVVDLRGHGKSVWRNVGWRRFGADDWKRYPQDALRVVRFFDGSEDYPQVDSHRAALIGASIGANTAILASARDNARIKSVAALSPSLDYKGLKPSEPIYQFKNAILLVASQDDPKSFEDTNMLYRLASGRKELLLYRNIGHGADMLRFYPTLMKTVTEWLLKALPPTPTPIPPPPPEADDENP